MTFEQARMSLIRLISDLVEIAVPCEDRTDGDGGLCRPPYARLPLITDQIGGAPLVDTGGLSDFCPSEL